MKKIVVIALLAAAAVCIVSCFSRSGAADSDIVSRVRRSVEKKWSAIKEEAFKASDLRDQQFALPESKLIGKDRGDMEKPIRAQLQKIRELLLSERSQDILARVDKLDARIAAARAELHAANEDRIINADRRGEYDSKIAKINEKIAALEASRAEQCAVVVEEIRSLGLRMDGASTNCVFTVNVGDLIDNAVVAKSVGDVVENLRELMDTADLATAKRYFGAYVVMVDVQIECFKTYLERSRNGEWKTGLDRISADAEAAKRNALANAESPEFTAAEREIFRRNAATNARTLEAAAAYVAILRKHEEAVQAKLAEAERIRQVAINSYDTVCIAGAFLDLVKTTKDAFDSLLELDLPAIASFDDSALQDEFNAITMRLRQE